MLAVILFPLPSMKCFGLFWGIAVIFVFLVANFFFPLLILLDYKRRKKSGGDPVSGGMATCGKYLRVQFDWVLPLHEKWLLPWKKTILVIFFLGGALLASRSFSIELETVSSPQTLFSRHPFEEYDRRFQSKFQTSTSDRNSNFGMTVAIGVREDSAIKRFNPMASADARFIEVDLEAQSQQQLLYDLCTTMVANKAKVGMYPSIQNMQCYPLFFPQWMHAPCNHTTDDSYPDTVSWLTPKRSTCCGYNTSNITFPREVFTTCISNWSAYYGGFTTGLWWEPSTNKIKAATLGMPSRTEFSDNYDIAMDYWDELNHWSEEFFKGTSLNTAYSTSNMDLLRYQRGLRVGFGIVTPLCMCIAGSVVFAMSRNIIAAFSVILSCALILWMIAGCLQLLGEKFGIFTSVSATVVMGVCTSVAALTSISFCESGAEVVQPNRVVVAQNTIEELTPQTIMASSSLVLASLCLLGGQTFYTFG
jgi:hypothetical protein